MTRPIFGSPTWVPSADFDALPSMYGLLNQPALELLFTQQVYRKSGVNYALANYPGWSFTRASTGYALNSAGALVSFGSGVPRITDLGLLIEQASTNLLLYSNVSGGTPGVLGSGGVLPTGWTLQSAVSGLVITFNGARVQNGVAGIELKYSSTPTASGFNTIRVDASGSVTASTTYTVSWYTQKVSGTTAPSEVIGGSQGFTTSPNFSSTATLVRQIQTSTVTGTGAFFGAYSSAFTSGVAADFTVFIGAPQFEQLGFATSWIPTTSASGTRAADAVTLTYSPNGSAATLSYGTSSTATPSAASPINLGSSSGGAWVNNYVRRLVIAK